MGLRAWARAKWTDTAGEPTAFSTYVREVIRAWQWLAVSLVFGLLGGWQQLVDSEILPPAFGPPRMSPVAFYVLSVIVIAVAPYRGFERLYVDLQKKRRHLNGVLMNLRITSGAPRLEYDMQTTDDCHMFALPQFVIHNLANASGVELLCGLEVEYSDHGGRMKKVNASVRDPDFQAENLLRGRKVPSYQINLAPGQQSAPADMMWFCYAPAVYRDWRKLTLILTDGVSGRTGRVDVFPGQPVNAPINTMPAAVP